MKDRITCITYYINSVNSLAIPDIIWDENTFHSVTSEWNETEYVKAIVNITNSESNLYREFIASTG